MVHRLIAVLIALSSLVAPRGDDLGELFRGVREVAAPGTPGGIAVFGADAFPVLTRRDHAPVIGGAHFGDGRVLAFGHGGFLGKEVMEAADTGLFLQNSVRWLAAGKRSPSIATPQNKPLAARLNDLGFGARVTRSLEDVDVVVLAAAAILSTNRQNHIENFVRDGGGLIVMGTGWGWAQLNKQKHIARDLPGNRLLMPMGLCLTTEAITTPNQRIAVAPRPIALSHAGRAFEALRSGVLDPADSAIALGRLRATIGAIPDYEEQLALPLRRFMERATELGELSPLRAVYEAREWRSLDVRFGPWRVIGPFPHPKGSRDIAPPHAPEKELERCHLDGAGPDLAASHRVRGGKLTWSLMNTAGDGFGLDEGVLSLNKTYPDKRRSVAYLYRSIEVDRAATLACRVGSDDGLRLWLNGELLVDRHSSMGMEVEELPVTLELPAGVNHLFIKVSNEEGAWGMRLRADTTLDTTAIAKAVSNGMDWLLEHQLLDGSSEGWPEYGPGYTAFMAYTLAKCGLEPNHAALERALAYLKSHPAEHTYSLSTAILALCAIGSEASLEPLQAEVDRLIEMQERSGLYSYPIHPGHGGSAQDLSCTLMAALAFRAAERHGVSVASDVWTKLIEGTLLCWAGPKGKSKRTAEEHAAGFAYHPGGKSSGSMTTAGLSVLQIARTRLGRKLKKRTRERVEIVMNSGTRWLEANWTWDRNPRHTGFHFYWLYGIERLGALLGKPILGNVDWYRSGAEFLLHRQGDDGSWKGEGGHGNERMDTCLALLFLRKATAPQSGRKTLARDVHTSEAPDLEISFRVRGEHPMSAWITGWGDTVREELGWRGAGAPWIESLRYVARRPGAGEHEALVLAELQGDPEALATQRFESRWTLPEAGDWELQVFAVARRPPAEPDGPIEMVELSSGLLLVTISAPADPRASRYATDPGRNLLRKGKVRVKASSHHGNQTPAMAVDGRYATRWHSSIDDALPRWEITLPRRVKADHLLLSHAYPRAKDRQAAQPKLIRVTLNGEESYELVIHPDPWTKTVLAFPGALKIGTLSIEILESQSRVLGRDAVGFSEIELTLGL